MAGSLIKIQETTVSTAVANVTLTGIDSTYDVYMVKFYNLGQVNDNTDVNIRFINSGGSAITASEYDTANMNLCADTTFRKISGTNNAQGQIVEAGGNQANELSNGILYIYNASNSSEFTFFTNETVHTNTATNLRGNQGGGVLTSAEAVTGVQVLIGSGNIDSGTFTLYGLKK